MCTLNFYLCQFGWLILISIHGTDYYVFKNYLDKFIIIFIDDILEYLKMKEKHEYHLKITL